MDSTHEIISQAACRLAKDLPMPTLQIIARLIGESSSLKVAKNHLVQLPQPHHRQLAMNFIDCCLAVAPGMPLEIIKAVTLTATVSEKSHRDAQSVELVWTGPDVGEVPFRRTEQAILQVLDSAQYRITLVSYAVYRIPNICEALIRAASRGVLIRVIVETPHKFEGQNEYNTLQALGRDVANCSAVYYWPLEKRMVAGEKVGILHVKCAVADGRWLFLSSANLTGYAFTINMELGVLVTGGGLPVQVEANFDRLIELEVFEKV
jgi:phosphatidylserine/phosphatidylglycerophosphate/cardiolipin synthase-like enzyme